MVCRAPDRPQARRSAYRANSHTAGVVVAARDMVSPYDLQSLVDVRSGRGQRLSNDANRSAEGAYAARLKRELKVRLFSGLAATLVILAACSSPNKSMVQEREIAQRVETEQPLLMEAAPPPERLTLARARADVATKAEPVFYDVEIQPRVLDGSTPVIKIGGQTTLSFKIGKTTESSVTAASVVNPMLTDAPTDTNLSVVLGCTFCQDHPSFLRRMVYRSKDRSSNPVEFIITAKKLSAAELVKSQNVEFSVFNDDTGQEYDHLTIPVRLATKFAPNAPAIKASAPISNKDFVVEGAPSPSGKEPDVTLYVMRDKRSRVAIRVNAVLPALVVALNGINLNPDGSAKSYASGLLNEKDVLKYTTGPAARITQVSLQDPLLKDAIRTATGDTLSLSDAARTTLAMNDDDNRLVVGVYADMGQTLWRHLFLDPGLAVVVKKLESFKPVGDRPLRIAIVTDAISLPWQFLHPAGPQDGNAFWGMKFSLTVSRTDVGAPAALRASTDISATRILFARYGEENDPSVSIASQEIDQLNEFARPKVTEVKSSAQFLAELLSDNRKSIGLIMALLHATDGIKLSSLNGEGIVVNDVNGPILRFDSNHFVDGQTLEGLLNKVTDGSGIYLPGRPIVILNACATGPAAPTVNRVSLQEALFALGAQGIIVTEAPVMDPLAKVVGERLINKLRDGETISDALVEIRKDLYATQRNPMGLLYSYYGNPTAMLPH